MTDFPRTIRFGRQDGGDRVVWGDNLATLEAQADETIDLIYIDPPFGTGTTRRGRRRQGRGPTLSYRDVGGDPDLFVEWLRPRLEHMRRTLTRSGSLFVHLDHRTVHYVKVALDGLFGRDRFINELIWCYSVGGKSRRTFGRKHDTILWYGRDRDYAFYPDAVRVPRKSASHMRTVLDENGRPVQEKTDRKTGKVYRYPVDLGKIPEDWWSDIETLNRGDGERTGWPTQKPERLLTRLLHATTVGGDTVADFFSGSGTTAAVAQRGDRRVLATDASLEAVEITVARLTQGGQKLAQNGIPPRDLRVDANPLSVRTAVRMA